MSALHFLYVLESSTTGRDALTEELPLERVSAERQSSSKVLMRKLGPATLQFKLAEGRLIKRIFRQALCIRNSSQRFEPAFRPIQLSDRDCAIERHYRSRANGHQCVIERHDVFPVRRLNARSAGMDCSDARFYVVFAQLRTVRR